jgi:hypothetical protein
MTRQITPFWTMFGKDLTAVLSSGEGWDDHCITWLAWRPGTELSGVREVVHKYGLSLQPVSSAQPVWTLLGCGSMVR